MSSTQFFHGVTITEVETPQGTVQLPSSSIIGVVGTAPNAQQSAAAGLDIGTTGANNALAFAAQNAGAAGNGISLQIRTPVGANAALAIQVNSDAITVFLATGSSAGVSTTTAAQLMAALAANAPALALVAATAVSPSTGAGLVANLAQTFLSGGLDAVAPLNTPVIVTPSQAGLFGVGGTLPQALSDIFDQSSPLVIVVCVEQMDESDTNEETITNVIGGISGSTYTGLKALLTAQAVTGSKPRLIIAPGFSSGLTVATEMLVEATSLKAVAIVDGPNSTNAAAIAYAQNFGDRRIYMVEAGEQFLNPATGGLQTGPASAVVAGLIAANDQNRGFWTSPSNQEILGIVGTARSVSFSLTDPNSDANYLNSFNIATIIRYSGFRLWGNRTLSLDPAYAFLSVGRTADLIEDALQAAHLWAVDLNIGKAYFQEVVASVQGFLDSLKAQGAILDGKIVADPALNSVANLAAGKVYFDISWTPPAPAEQLNMIVNPVATTGYANILPSPTSS